MNATEVSTELRILEAAKRVFHHKGYDGARMQEIADEAGVNKSLVHYYYRNKDNIFKAVFEDAFSKLMTKLNEIFLSELPFKLKIETFVAYYISFLAENSYLPLFILNEIYKNPEQLKQLIEKQPLNPQALMDKVRNEMKDELNIDIDPFHIYINILALSIFPVIARPIIQIIFGYSPAQLEQFYSERQKLVPEFIINAIKGYEDVPAH